LVDCWISWDRNWNRETQAIQELWQDKKKTYDIYTSPKWTKVTIFQNCVKCWWTFAPSAVHTILLQALTFSILSARVPVHPRTEMSIVNMQLIINTNYYCAERIRLHPNQRTEKFSWKISYSNYGEPSTL
jgi:hypothetical protein